MKFKEWLRESGMSMFAVARMCSLSRGTIKNLVEGKRPYIKTVKKLVMMTKAMKHPITNEMFKEIKRKNKGT